MKYYLAFTAFVLCFGFVAIAAAHHDFSYSVPQDQRYGVGYFDHFRPGPYPSPYWSYPYVPAKMAVAATKERLWANKYMNPNSVHWQVQETKERLWAIKNPYYGNWHDYGWMERSSWGNWQ